VLICYVKLKTEAQKVDCFYFYLFRNWGENRFTYLCDFLNVVIVRCKIRLAINKKGEIESQNV